MANAPKARQIFITPIAVTPTAVTNEAVTIPAGAAGVVVEFFIQRKPIIDSNRCFIGGFGDTSLILSGAVTFTTEVSSSTPDESLSNGQYWVDYITGRCRGRKANTGVAITANYYIHV